MHQKDVGCEAKVNSEGLNVERMYPRVRVDFIIGNPNLRVVESVYQLTSTTY